MKIAKIKNSAMYRCKGRNYGKGQDPHGTHDYLVYFDRKNHRNKAVQLNHLYEIPSKKKLLLKKKEIMRIDHLPGRKYPSCISRETYNGFIDGSSIELTSPNVKSVSKTYLSKKSSDSVKDFLCRSRKR